MHDIAEPVAPARLRRLLRNAAPAFLAILLTASLVSGCAQPPAKPLAGAAPAAAAAQDDDDDAGIQDTASAPALPDQELTAALFYDFLVAELSLQRGDRAGAAKQYVELARRTRDPRVARRAVELSRFANDPKLGAEAAKTDPASSAAQSQLAIALILAGRADEAVPYLERVLAQPGANLDQGFGQIGQVLGQTPDRAAALRVMQKLAAAYPKEPRAHLETARAALAADQDAVALAEAREAMKLRPGWEQAALVEALVLQRRSNAAAIEFLAGFLKANPGAREARLQYARFLFLEKKYPEARAEFQKLLAEFPDNVDVVFSVAVLSMQLEDWPLAEANLKRLLELPVRDRNTVLLYLGQVAEAQKHYDEALRWLRQVGGEQAFRAQIQQAQVLAKRGDVAAARQLLQKADATRNEQRVQLILAEAQILRDANQPQEAFLVVERGLDRLPENPDLLYDYAMLAEKLDRIDIMESSLRKVIRIKPDHAHAYNALGYTFADRNQRLAEARELIEKALALEPDNPMIIDSMGWVLYRQGDLQGALKYLERAYQLGRKDPEIAAHLGEVLWVLGRRKEAEAVWAEAAARAPGHDVLLKTVQRLKQ
ncbi:MAG: tetratricopeptide repeat protein [Burkholderiales bacterium]|nr:tetratricopeptide repeat protein [Burkholderiales bacterium]